MKKLIITIVILLSGIVASAQWDPTPWYMPRYFTNGTDTLAVSTSDSAIQLISTTDTFYISGNELVYIPNLATDSLISNFIEALNMKVDSITADYVNRADTAGHLENWDTTTINNKINDAYYPDLVENTEIAGDSFDISFGKSSNKIDDFRIYSYSSAWNTEYSFRVGNEINMTVADNDNPNLFSFQVNPNGDACKLSVTTSGNEKYIDLKQGNGIDIRDQTGYGLVGLTDFSSSYTSNSYVQWGATKELINDSLQRVNDSLAAHLATLQAHADSINDLRDDIGSGGGGDGINWLVATNSTTGKGAVDTVFQFDLDTNTYHLEMDTATTIDWTNGSQGDRYIFMLYQDAVGGRELYFMPGKWQAEHGILNISTGSNDTNVVSGYHTGSKVILSIIQNADKL